MRVSNAYLKRNNVQLKIIVILILVSFCWAYFYLFYDLKCETRVRNATLIAQNTSTVQEEDEEIVAFVGESGCAIPYLTNLYDDKITKLKRNLSEFYSKTPSSVELSNRCKRFEKTSIKNNSSIEQRKVQSYFADGRLVTILKNSSLLKASIPDKGTMPKLFLYFPDNFIAIFKPKWYRTNEILEGLPHWRGKDRHFGEVVAFYLSILLDFKNVPAAAIRKIDVEKLSLVSEPALLRTFIFKNNRTCFSGGCSIFCHQPNLICADVLNTVEGSVIIHLPSHYKLKSILHPWKRTFFCNVSSNWEIDNNYCANIRSSKFFSANKNPALFYDIMDGAIFDFLIDNGDRHHCDYIENKGIPRMIFLDNGRSFANPYIDHIDILAPLYQCCSLRNSTWNTLLNLRGGNLSYWLRHLLHSDPDIVLLKRHFNAVDRRLATVFTVLEDCFDRKGGVKNVIVNDY